ncbi:MobF family relaxase, partial [Acidiphilium sp.]|uniref:MobF family relaxase n=1 Tax=Acidiphilium sp. TaxID=527 RepID=UPI003D03655F
MEIMLMLSTKPLKNGSARGIVAYCRHSKSSPTAKGGYYMSAGAPSFWTGRLANDAGLTGPVEPADFLDALEGKIGGEDIRKGRADRRHGSDVTFSAPKSVSLMCLAGGDQRIAEAHDAAVRAGMEYIEKEVAASRYGKNGLKTARGGGIAAAVFRHEDSRSVSGEADPQLHSHAIVVNMTTGGDGKLRAIDLDWGQHAVRMHLADAVYKTILARNLISLGYAVEATGDGFELADISPYAIEHFSQRRNQIDQALKSAGIDRTDSTATQRTAANLRTRQGKSSLSQQDQRHEWHNRAVDIGLGLPGVVRRAIRSGTRPAPESTAGAAVRSAARHLNERSTIFSKDQIRLDALKNGIGSSTIDEIDRAIAAGEAGLLDVGAGAMTTVDALYKEQT